MPYAAILTIARFIQPYDHPISLDFYKTAWKVYEQAAQSGELLKFMSEDGINLPMETFNDDVDYSALTLSVWKDIGGMYRFTFSGEHLLALKNRKQWLKTNIQKKPNYVIWWTENEEEVTWEEGFYRYNFIERNGPSPFAFNFLKVFDANGKSLSSNEWKNGKV